MTYETIERSTEDGRPISLYAFTLGSVTWRYTSADETITAGGFVWKSAAISDDGIRQTGETADDALQIEAPSWIGPSQVYMTAAPLRPIQLAVFEKHEGSADIKARYVGEVTQVNFPIPGRCRVTCETLTSTLSREGLRLGWQRSCPYVVYDPLTCRLNKATWGVPFIVHRIDGSVLDIECDTLKAAAYFSNGFAEYTHPVQGTAFLMVEQSDPLITGPVVAGVPNTRAVVINETGDMYPGMTGIIYPGCDFTPAKCQSFGNYDNYGGHDDLPGRSPFDGNPVF